MIEKILFGNLEMPGEMIRIALVLLGTAIGAYFDLKNNKNIPDNFLYVFLGVAFITNLVFFNYDVSLFAIGLAVVISLIGFLFYKLGQLGGADVFILASIALLLPITPSFVDMTFNIPFILSVLVFSGVIFSLYLLIHFTRIIINRKAKPNYIYLILLIPYLLFAYIYFNFPFISYFYFIVVSIVIFSTIFFLAYKKDINGSMVKLISLNKAEPENILATEFMDKKLVEKYKLQRLLNENELQRLKKLKIKKLWIYTDLPPFLPFILLGVLCSLLLSNLLILSF